MKLTPDQAADTRLATEALNQETPADLYGMAGRIGQLEYHLGQMLQLIGQITQQQEGGAS